MRGHVKKIGIVCCSNGMKQTYAEKLKMLEEMLISINLQPVFSDYIYEKDGVFGSTAKERAQALMDFYKDEEIEEIFDISGGDLANGILPYLDYDLISRCNKRFWGYSDLTTVINAIYAKTGRPSVLYQIRNVLSEYWEQQVADVQNILVRDIFVDNIWSQNVSVPIAMSKGRAMEDILAEENAAEESEAEDTVFQEKAVREENNLFRIRYHFVQGTKMQGVVIGGNIRCFLKLAGTEYMPDFQDKILLLESRSGLVPQMETFLSQLQQLGAFDKISGILLGTFTKMEEKQEELRCKNTLFRYGSSSEDETVGRASEEEGILTYPTMAELVQAYVRSDMPIAVTRDIGHGKDSKGIIIGEEMIFS